MNVSFTDEGISMGQAEAVFLASVLAECSDIHSKLAQKCWLDGDVMGYRKQTSRSDRAQALLVVVLDYVGMQQEEGQREGDYGDEE